MLQICIAIDEAARCLSILKAATEPITAIVLARRLGLSGSRETMRRRVRAIVKQLRDGGAMIVAVGSAGYLVTDDRQIYRDYLEGRQIDAKRVLGQTHSRKKMLLDAAGQGLLFQPTGGSSCGKN